MQLTQDSISIGANATDQNVLNTQGKRIRTAPEGNRVWKLTLFCTGSAAGLYASLYTGSENPIENSAINAQNRVPVVPDDVLATDIFVRSGEQIQLSVQNTTAGALTFNYRIELEDVTRAFMR